MIQSFGNSAKCVFASDIDENARKTYEHNYGIKPVGDITKINETDILPHDFLFAGFPCQAFSIAGKRDGFNDTRGTLFFDVARIMAHHKPKIAILENVKGLLNHDNGKTFKVILETLKNLNYFIQYKVLNTATHANIPQNRERVYIVASLSKLPDVFPEETPLTANLFDFLLKEKQAETLYYKNHRYSKQLEASITSRQSVYQWRRQYVRENKSGLCPTLTANMGTGGHNVPLILDDFGIRKLTDRECLRFQGFDESFSFPNIANSQKYKQIGNSISIPLAVSILKNIFGVNHER
jgi:DNA (cytosine-5)-methyltransferase 1